MFVGVSQRGLIRRSVDSEVNQLAQTTGQPVADLAQRVRVSQLAEQHRHQLRPATEALGGPFGPVFPHQRRELQAREVLQQLIKQAHCLYHSVCPPVGDSTPNCSLKRKSGAGTIIGGLVFCSVQTDLLSWTRVNPDIGELQLLRALAIFLVYFLMLCGWLGVGLFIVLAPRRFGNLVNESFRLFPSVGPRDWGKKLFLRLVGLLLLAFAARFVWGIYHNFRPGS